MPTRDFYTLAEAARVPEIPQRLLLKILETGEIKAEEDPLSSRWRIPKHAVDGLVLTGPSPEGPTEESPERSTEMIQQLVDELGNLHRQVGHLRTRLDRARRAENDEREHLLAELEQEREGRRQEREEAESTLQAEQERWQKERERLQEELETERNKGSWRRLLGG